MDGAHELASRNYRGITPPPAPPAPRDVCIIISELRCAGLALAEVADRLEVFPTGIALASADTLITGAGRLLVELRQVRA